MKNDVFPVTAGTFASPTGATQSTTSIIMNLLPEDIITETLFSPSGFGCKLQMKNHTSYVPVVALDGTSGGGSAVPDIVANLTAILLMPAMPPV